MGTINSPDIPQTSLPAAQDKAVRDERAKHYSLNPDFTADQLKAAQNKAIRDE